GAVGLRRAGGGRGGGRRRSPPRIARRLTQAAPLPILPALGDRKEAIMFLTWLWQRWNRKQTRPGTRPSRPRFLPRLEALEDRTLPSTFTVTTLSDSGAGSLRSAVQSANLHPGADVIQFASGLTGSIALTSGQITITDDVSIAGPGADKLTVSGNNQSRVFFVSGLGTDVTLSDVRIAQGKATQGA